MALNFNGTNQYVDCGNNASLNITEGTWMSWIKIPASSTYERVVFKYAVDASLNVWGYWVQLLNTGVIQGGVGNNTASWGYYKNGSVVLDDDSIHHIAASFSNSDGLRIYQDGTEVSGTLGGGSKPSTIGTSGHPLFISAEHSTLFSYGKGQKWDVRVYNRVLSANEIAEIYHKRGADKVWQGLVGWWRLDDLPSGTPAPLLLDAMDATTGWSASSSDSISLNTTTYQEGSGAINFIKGTTVRTYSWMYKTITSVNVTGQTIKLWIYIKDQTTLNKISHIHARLYSTYNTDAKYGVMNNADLAVGWNLFSMHINDFEDMGTPNITAIKTLRVQVNTNNNSDTISEGNVVFDFYRAGDYPFQVTDLSGNGNHGTLYGGTFQASPHRLRRGVLVS